MLKEKFIDELLEALEKIGKNHEVLPAIEIIKNHDEEEIRKLLVFDEEYKRELIRFLNICYDARLILKSIEKNELFKHIQGISDYTIADNEIQLLEAYKNIANYFEFVGIKTICSEYYEALSEIFKILENMVLKYKSFDNKVLNNILSIIDEKNINVIECLKEESKDAIELYKNSRYYMLYDYCIRAYLVDVIYSKKYFGYIPELSDCINIVTSLNIKISQEEKLDLIRNIFRLSNLIKKHQELNEQLKPQIEGSNQTLNLI